MTAPLKNEMHIEGTACIITGGLFDTIHAKTAHGLIRDSKRFEILGVVDEKFAGEDAGELLDGKRRGIPVKSTLTSLILELDVKPDYAIIGMATKGGVLTKGLYPVIEEAFRNGIHVVNGLHQPISGVSELQTLANANQVRIYDIRKPKTFEELHFWTGKIREITSLKVGLLGTDCAVGKRTTAKLLNAALNEADISSQMIYTGQTGWLQGTKYGFIFDSTPNDFIPGELEHALYTCWRNDNPEVMLVEGQASLRNPSGPCGSEFIISARLDGVILQHHPIRKYFNGLEGYPANIPDPEDEIKLIDMLGAETWAVTLNTSKMDMEQVRAYQKDLEARIGIPVVCPIEDGLEVLVNVIKERLNKYEDQIDKSLEKGLG